MAICFRTVSCLVVLFLATYKVRWISSIAGGNKKNPYCNKLSSPPFPLQASAQKDIELDAEHWRQIITAEDELSGATGRQAPTLNDTTIVNLPIPPPQESSPSVDSPSPFPSDISSSPLPPPPPPPPTPQKPKAMTPSQRRRAEALTNVFEFSSTLPQYGYAEDLGDGRGITFGRCGFCTATGDGVIVIAEYVRRNPDPNNTLAAYLPALQFLDSLRGTAKRDFLANNASYYFANFSDAVTSLANDALFQQVQDWAQQNMYYAPSQRLANSLGLRLGLARAQLYDAYIMHGENDPGSSGYNKSANGMADWVTQTLGGSPATTGVDESLWISTYLQHRADILSNAGRVWNSAVNRVQLYQWIQAAGVEKLNRKIVLSYDECATPPVLPNVCSVNKASVRVAPCDFGDFVIP